MRFTAQNLIISFISCICIFFSSGNEVYSPKKALPFCGLAESSNRFIFVSTLDGKLTALNPNNNGAVVWTIHPGSESLLSSSIHKLELSNYGHLVRMIPSLKGGLYKFNGENVEVIPVSSDHLLQSSLRYSDDLVISGGRETHTFGVSLKSGHIIYECSMKGCGNASQSTDSGEILVVQRRGQIVRAVEPRTGTERWNFSVAEHDLKLTSDCSSLQSSELNYNLRVIIPKGIIYAADSKNPKNILWKQKFDSPVVNAWQLHNGRLVEIDLFISQPSNLNSVANPSIYIGMHDKQLYIQESVAMLKKRHEITFKAKQNLVVGDRKYPVIPWKPISASDSAFDVVSHKLIGSENLDESGQRQTTALSVLYASPYVNGNGFFLFTEEDQKKIEATSCNVENDKQLIENESNAKSESDSIFPFSEETTTVEVVVSFWYYWKEVLVISATTAIIFNFMVTRTYWKWKFKNFSSTSVKTDGLFEKKPLGPEPVSRKSEKIFEFDSDPDYISRYLTDFDPVACLGKGGFGVVFEAKNKIDDCNYAIKRILLPKREESRDRVLREVKALAKLDHHHIVRYFNAWTECPPLGWQEKQDKSWFSRNSEVFTSGGISSNRTSTLSSAPKSESSNVRGVGSFYPMLSSESRDSKHLDELKSTKDEVSDSFIVFDNGTESRRPDNNVTQRSQWDVTVTSVNVKTDEEYIYSSESSHLEEAEKNKSKKLNNSTDGDFRMSNKVYLYIQMQLCQRHSLKDWLTTNKERDYLYVLNIFEQILQAVEHVHLHGLIHRDLKPSNIFFSLNNEIKVGDFGLVTTMINDEIQASPTNDKSRNLPHDSHTAQVGTQLYMSQEQLLGKPYNYKVDIYSLGLILFELLVSFNTQMERIHVLQNIKRDKFPEAFKKMYKKEHELLRLMLSDSPEERPTTYGVRARLPLKQDPVETNWHFELPSPKTFPPRNSHSISSSEGSGDSY